MDNTQFLQPGATLWNNTYRIEKILGHGGFGITYLAMDTNLEKRVAIKEFFIGALCSRDSDSCSVITNGTNSADLIEKYKTKFLKEARSLAKLSHPNLVSVSAAFEENGTAYYVMDYIDGGNLQQLVRTNGPLPLAVALNYTEQVARALDYLHSQKLNHLDVKPANIMRRQDGSVALIDFGLAKQYDSAGNQTSTTPVGISNGFAPLEQYNQEGLKSFSPATDVYALAATFYFLVSGLVPPSATDLIEAELYMPDMIPEGMRAPLRKAFNPSRKYRQQSAGEFINDLKNPRVAPQPPVRTATRGDEGTQIMGGGATGGGGGVPTPPQVIHSASDANFGEQQKRNKKPLIIISIVAGILLLAGITVGTIFLAKGGGNVKGTANLEEANELINFGVLDTPDFRVMLQNKLEQYKETSTKFSNNYVDIKDFYNPSILTKTAQYGDYEYYEVDANKIPAPETITLTEYGVELNYGKSISYDQDINIVISYEELIPFLSRAGLAVIPEYITERHKKAVGTISNTRVQELLNFYKHYDHYYLNGFTPSYNTLYKLDIELEDIYPHDGPYMDDAYPSNFNIIYENEDEAKVSFSYSAYENQENAFYILKKTQLEYPSGLKVDAWLIDDAENDDYFNYLSSKDNMANYINNSYSSLKAPGGIEQAWQEDQEGPGYLSEDMKSEWAKSVNTFITDFEEAFPDGIAKP